MTLLDIVDRIGRALCALSAMGTLVVAGALLLAWVDIRRAR